MNVKSIKNWFVVGKAQKIFCMGLNNYKRPYKSFKTQERGTKKLFQSLYIHKSLTDQCCSNTEFKKGEVYWQHCLKNLNNNKLTEQKVVNFLGFFNILLLSLFFSLCYKVH